MLRFCAYISLVICSLSPAYAKNFRIVTTDFCPFVCENGKNKGYVIDLIREIFSSQEASVEVNFSSWARVLENTRNGQSEAALSPARSEAPGFIFPDEPVGVQRFCFFRRAQGFWEYNGPASLKTEKLGVMRDVSYPDIMDWLADSANSASIDSASTNGTEQNFRKLVAGRNTVILEDEGVGSYYIKLNNLDVVKAGCLAGEPIYLGLSPKTPEASTTRAKIFDTRLRALRASGALNDILVRYGLSDWK